MALAALALATGLGGCAAVDRKPPDGSADLVLRNGKVVAVERMRALATMVGGKFVYTTPEFDSASK